MNKFLWLVALLMSVTIPALGQSQSEIGKEYVLAREQALSGSWRDGMKLETRLATAPDGFALAYSICGKENEACAYSQATLGVDMPFAYRGHYQAQRNLAFCLFDGCDGAIVPNQPLGCAWRIVILASGSSQVDDGDRANLDLCFKQMDAIGYATMRSQARILYATIYNRPIDPAWISG